MSDLADIFMVHIFAAVSFVLPSSLTNLAKLKHQRRRTTPCVKVVVYRLMLDTLTLVR